MSLVTHILIALGYVVLSVGIAIAVATEVPGASLAIAVAFGCSAALGAALSHLGWLGWKREVALRRTVDRLRDQHDRVAGELEKARSEIERIAAALDSPNRDNGYKDVVADVSVLQRLVEQLWTREKQPVPGASAAPADRAEAAPAVLADEAAVLDTVRRSLSAGRVELFLQPVVGLPQRRRRFFECFSRLRSEDGSFVSPEDYLPLVARENLLPAIDNMLLFRCIQLIRKARAKAAGVGFFCNISRRSLADRDFINDFIDFLRQNEDLASNLIFEVGQPDVDLQDPVLAEHFDRLARAGIRFSLDNVSDLALDPTILAQRNFGFVKIDAGLFQGADPEGPWEGSLFQLRRRLADHGIVLILEKIETERQLVELLEFNIELGQGFLFGEPRLSADAA